MISMVVDDAAWYQAWLDTPIGMPRTETAAEAMKTPGCCVKSREHNTEGTFTGLPMHYGKLVMYTDDRVVVRGYGDCTSPKFVWRGTKAEYHAVWECD